MGEIPPTAGLPLHWRDLLPLRPSQGLPERMAALLGIEAPQITCSGTAALVVALSVLASESERREVVVPGYTCPLVALAVACCGLTLRVCDLRPGTLEMESAALAALCGSRTLAIVPTCIGGRVPDILPVLECAQRAGAAVIEDGAQALGARHPDGIAVGMRGDIGFYSLAAGKGLTTYEGGLLMSRHPALRNELARMAQTLGPRRNLWELRRCIALLGYAVFYRPRGLPLVYGAALRRALRRGDMVTAAGDGLPAKIAQHRMGAWRQSVAVRASMRWPAFQLACERQARRRRATLAGIEGVAVVDDAPGARGVWPVLMVLLPDGAARDAVLDRLWGAGVGVGVPFARALPDYRSLRGMVAADDVAHARSFAARVLSISNSPWLDDATFDRIADCIARVVSSKAPATVPG